MKANLSFLVGIALLALTACSTQEIKQDDKTLPATKKPPAITGDSAQNSGQNPPPTLLKDNLTLNLVKIMDGGACKNDFQGAKGVFLIYADPADIERIKAEKGPKIFNDFELKIQDFSTKALQEAISATNLSEDPFALGADEAQEKLTKHLFSHFRDSIANPVKQFQTETSLTLDIVPFAPSFIFYQQGCDAAHLEPETQ